MTEKKEPDSLQPCPNYVFLKKGVNGELQLEIPSEYIKDFKPISEATYKRWLEEAKKDPVKMKEVEDDEVEYREEEN